MRPLGTVLTSAAQLDDAPWQAVLLTSPRLLRTTRPLPFPHVWFRTTRTSPPNLTHHAQTRTPVPVLTPHTLLTSLDPLPQTPAFALTPDFPLSDAPDLLRALRRTRWQFVRLDNWREKTRVSLLAPSTVFGPAFLAQVLQHIGPETPVLVTRPTLTDTLHDIGVIRLWDAYAQHPQTLPLQARHRIQASQTRLCPLCPQSPPLDQFTCRVCLQYWGLSEALLSTYPPSRV